MPNGDSSMNSDSLKVSRANFIDQHALTRPASALLTNTVDAAAFGDDGLHEQATCTFRSRAALRILSGSLRSQIVA